MPLSDFTCRNAKPKRKVYKLSDGMGLCLRILTAGGKYWELRYYYGGKQKSLSLGVYPAVTLVTARALRDDARKLLREGVDPGIARLSQRVSARLSDEETFEAVARAWHETKKGELSPRFAGQILSRLESDVFPSIGRLPIRSVGVPHLLGMLRKIQARGALETMHRVKQYCGMIFRFAIAGGVLENDPTANLRGALPAPKHTNYATIDAADLPDLLLKLSDEQMGIGLQTRLAIRFLMLTFVRTSEMIGAKRSEIDIANALWTIPAARMKKSRDHLVPLSCQAIEILNIMDKLVRGDFVFPGRHSWKKPISNMTVLKGLQRMGYKGRMTGHGFRALATTILREGLGYNSELTELQLAHAPENKTKAAYDRAKFLKQRREMMQAWADYIDDIEKQARRQKAAK